MMSTDPHDVISENTETTAYFGEEGWRHFLSALGWGTVTGTALVVAYFAIAFGPSFIVLALVFGGFVVGAFTLIGMTVIGLPVAYLLKWLDCEDVGVYAVFGACAGIAMLVLTFGLPVSELPEILVVPLAGALTGLVSALRWGRWRASVSRHRQAADAKPTNPIHDLLH